jgi:dihydrolipoyl dehydrogenase
MADRYDTIVIGSGPGGYVAAIRAAQLGMKTAVVEKDALGGRCLNVACIPAKAMLRAADVLGEIEDSKTFGISVDNVSFDMAGAGKHRDRVVKTLTGGVGGLFKKNKIEVLEGHGTLAAAGKVTVEGKEIEAGKVVLATGSVSLPIPGASFGDRVVDTAGAWLLNERPERLAVVGAGASGAEIASAFGRFGTEVVLLEMLDQILPAEDAEIAKVVSSELKKQNVTVVTGTRVEGVKAGKSSVEVTYGDQTESFDYLCIAAGRGPDVEGLGLDGVGVKMTDRGEVEVDGRMHTSVDGVYAIGDLVHGPALAHKASDEGVIAVEDAAGMETHPIDQRFVPAATFCYPQVASFGLTEQEARDEGYDVTVGKIPITAVGAPTVYGDRGMVKIVGEKKYGEMLGGHVVCAKAADLIQELVVARDLEGGYPEVARSIHPHPAFAEAVMEAARAADGWLIHG